jgi:hypothetical protein
MLYTVLRPHQPQLHLPAVQPPLYLLLWLQEVARAASSPLPPPLTCRWLWGVVAVGRRAATLTR